MKFLAYIIILFTLFINAFNSLGQNYCNLKTHWFFGRNLTSTGVPTDQSLHMEFQCPTGNLLSVTPYTSVNAFGPEGTAVINDFANGNWSIFSDGDNVLYSSGQLPSINLGATPFTTVPVAICPIQLCPVDSFYIFSNPTGTGGFGTITWRRSNISGIMSAPVLMPLPTSINVGNATNLGHGEGMLLVPKKNNPGDFWLITRLLKDNGNQSTDAFIVYDISPNNISINQIFDANTDGNNNIANSILSTTVHTNFVYSELRQEIAISDANSNLSVFTINFDATLGTFSGGTTLQIGLGNLGAYDVEYSPDNSLLYYSHYITGEIFAYNLSSQTSSLILADNSNPNNRSGGLNTGPDGNIYAATYGTSNWTNYDSKLWQITNPNTASSVLAPINSFSDWQLINFPAFITPISFNITANANLSCVNDTAQIEFEANMSQVNYNSISWYQDSVLIPNMNDTILSTTQPGKFYADIEFLNGCIFQSDIIEIIDSTLDLSLTISAINCLTDSVEYELEICNNTTNDFLDSIPISFYDQDPFVNNSNLLTAETIFLNVVGNSCITINLTLDTQNDTVFIVLNDPGLISPPYSIANFPFFIEECDYTNNFDNSTTGCCFGIANLPNDTIYCENENLSPITPITPIIGNPSWYSDNLFQNIVSTNPTITPNNLIGIQNFFFVDSSANCAYIDSISIEVNPLPTISTSNDTIICFGNQITLNANSSNNSTISWSDNVINNQSFQPTTTNTFFVSATTIDGCLALDSVTVNVNPLPQYSINYQISSQCDNEQTGSINIEPAPGAITPFAIFIGNAPSSLIIDSLFPGSYPITIIDNNGCPSTEIVILESFENNLLEADFSYSPQTITTLNNTVNFINQSENATTFEWEITGLNFNQLFYSNSFNVSFPEYEAFYKICLIASIDNNCPDTICKIIKIEEEPLIYVPNSFTPDLNDYNGIFIPVFSDLDLVNYYNLKIYNRWGEILFESYNPLEGWDGSYYKNIVSMNGVYVWTIEYSTKLSDKKEILRGHVTLLR